MARPTFLSFANVTAAAALVIATTGGGFAVAAGLGKNVVGSPQIKKSAVKSSDVKNDGLLGKDIREATLATVPSAAKAATVDTVVTKRVTTTPSTQVVFATKGTFEMLLRCSAGPNPNELEAAIVLRTTANDASMDGALAGDEDEDLDVGEAAVAVGSGPPSTTPEIEAGTFSAVSAAGVSWKGSGYAIAHPLNTNTCSAEMTFLG